MTPEPFLVEAEAISKRFADNVKPAVDRLDLRVSAGEVTGLIGPDGAGKTTLMRLLAGLLLADEGKLTVCGCDPREESSELRRQISYMPQRFGLYEDLTVQENLDLYADLHGVVGHEREQAFERLMDFTALARFTDRLAGKLSGGMKQKLGLACALVRRPRLMLLDEPSVGVDPISRRELWRMVYELVEEGIGVVWSTAYLDEAERCDSVLLLNEGQALYDGPPGELTGRIEGRSFLVYDPRQGRRKILAQALRRPDVIDGVIQGSSVRLVVRKGAGPPDARGLGTPEIQILPTPPRFEDAFVDLLGGARKVESELGGTVQGSDDRGVQRESPDLGTEPDDDIRRGSPDPAVDQDFGDLRSDHVGVGRPAPNRGSAPNRRPAPNRGTAPNRDVVVEARDLTKRFGEFTAADRITFQIQRGEIFGLLGPNGAGKSTTFKMMCGLLKPSEGSAEVAGFDLYRAGGAARAHLGYMAQKFSLYGDLSVRQNLNFFAGVYGVARRRRAAVIDRMIEAFGLETYLDTDSGELPLGFKQRLALACAVMHGPSVLFLDEPTSGVDPLTRREFWSHINALVERGVTIMVTTHFMDEAEYCDRIGLVYQGHLIADGSPDDLKQRVRGDDQAEPTLEDAFIALVEGYDRVQSTSRGR